MNFIQTTSFKLAVRAEGNSTSPKLALLLPGRLDTKDYAHNVSHVHFLAEQGYYALSFDLPGTWDSPGDIRTYSTTTYLQVVSELIDHFSNKPTLLVGHSRGGSIAMLASANPAVEAIVCVMATYGSPSQPNAEAINAGFQMEYRDLPPGSHKTEEKRSFKLPLNYFEDGKKYDPVAELQKLSKPKLLVYADKDAFTLPDRVEEVFASLKEPKQLLKVESTHDYRLYPNVIVRVNRAVAQLI